jgi:hypothetical protein
MPACGGGDPKFASPKMRILAADDRDCAWSGADVLQRHLIAIKVAIA